MSLDPAADFRLFDYLEGVTYIRVTADGSEAMYEGVQALRRAIKGVPVAMGAAQAIPDRATWHIQVSTLPVVPRRGDKIVSSLSGTWVVQSDEVETLATRYRCNCQKLEG